MAPDRPPEGDQDYWGGADTQGSTAQGVAAMPGKSARRHQWSTFIAVAMVLGAGAVAWFGSAPRAAEGGPRREAATLGVLAPRAEPGLIRSVSTGGLPTRVVIPAAGIDAPVVGVTIIVENGVARWGTADEEAGHHIDSAMPGQPGNMVISGHVSLADPGLRAVFATLDRVREGDIIEVYAGAMGYRYVVESIEVVDPDAIEVLRSDSRAIVTLITCTPDLEHRLVVRGRLIGGIAEAGPA
jgi:LPXTG-site transpeptidase (sortase) family protein